jgi:hypothetical protein
MIILTALAALGILMIQFVKTLDEQKQEIIKMLSEESNK